MAFVYTPALLVPMNVYLNSELIAVEDNITLHTFLEIQHFGNRKGIAVAINNRVVQRQEWPSCTLQENDKVLIISATRGG